MRRNEWDWNNKNNKSAFISLSKAPPEREHHCWYKKKNSVAKKQTQKMRTPAIKLKRCWLSMYVSAAAPAGTKERQFLLCISCACACALVLALLLLFCLHFSCCWCLQCKSAISFASFRIWPGKNFASDDESDFFVFDARCFHLLRAALYMCVHRFFFSLLLIRHSFFDWFSVSLSCTTSTYFFFHSHRITM